MEKATQKPYTAQMIPDFSDKTIEGARQWWRKMLHLGLYIHPEDGAENYSHLETGGRMLDDEASEKVNSIYREMFSLFGEEETYDAGMTEWWAAQGYRWDEQKQEWVK